MNVSKKVTAGAFYVPPSDTSDAPVYLTNIMTACSEDTLIVGIDFNLPAITGVGGSFSLSDQSSVTCMFLDIVNTFGIHQFVELQSRGDNVLDVLLRNLKR